MALALYNTLTRRKEPFTPIDPANVRVYGCGVTVYDRIHIGNGRMMVVFDLLFRVLRHVYGERHVTYARNITDVDDKINARAVEEGVTIRELTQRTTLWMHEDVAGLGCMPPSVEPRATDHIEEMKTLCEMLVQRGHAYVAESHVLFHVPSMADYGRLSNRTLEEMQAGARVDVAPYKRDAMDFVLWKPSKSGEPAWPSPCGIAEAGRPGWHIECSAMAGRHLGQVFDIHGGGIDLVFPHHENEIAQSRCAHGTPVMANVWMHNGFLEAEAGEKMSKSLGNFITVRELLDRAPGEAGRLALLASLYRQPLPWSEKGVVEARRTLDHWYELTADATDGAAVDQAVLDALLDDLNTPAAIAALHALRSDAAKGSKGAAAALKSSARLMGFLQLSPADWKSWRPVGMTIDEAEIRRLIAARLTARKAKDFKEGDRIRDALAAQGIVLKDGKDPTTGEIVTTWEAKV
ncbi:MAG TPA: cysteine--tRNA ligase [Hyphomicrobiaceae bacterium]|nr:cysteine--tRNA ligase [Hyphomicrobiaceae bacterium]